MFTFIIDGREYRTCGCECPLSGRLLHVESLRASGVWKTVKNVSRREQVLQMLEMARAA